MRRDNLIVADGLSVDFFFTKHYNDLIESATNIIRGNTKYLSHQRKSLAEDLVSLLCLHLKQLETTPPNLGAYSHAWMKNQSRWERTDFDKIKQRNSYDFNTEKSEDNDDCLLHLLDSINDYAGLDPSEQAVFTEMRKGKSLKEIGDDFGITPGAVSYIISLIKKKFADARVNELLEDGMTHWNIIVNNPTLIAAIDRKLYKSKNERTN